MVTTRALRDLGTHLRSLRVMRSLRLSDAAEACGCSAADVSSLEDGGVHNPSLAAKLSAYYKTVKPIRADYA